MAESTRVASLAMLLESTGTAYLTELYGKTIENVQKQLLSATMKNQNLSGDPASGSVEVKRFANASGAAYGAARTAGAGAKVKVRPVVIQIDQNREIVEELEDKDVRLFGVENVLGRRASNHAQRMAAELDRKFFEVAAAGATSVTIASTITDVTEELEKVIQECENTQNAFVDGVDRSMMHLVLSTSFYGKIRSDLDKKMNPNVDTAAEEFYAWHGVRCDSCVHLPTGCDYLLICDGAVAQPAMSSAYSAEKIPLSNAYGVSLFYNYGTKVITPDLIFKKAA